jgi:hypothetical protein
VVERLDEVEHVPRGGKVDVAAGLVRLGLHRESEVPALPAHPRPPSTPPRPPARLPPATVPIAARSSYGAIWVVHSSSAPSISR